MIAPVPFSPQGCRVIISDHHSHLHTWTSQSGIKEAEKIAVQPYYSGLPFNTLTYENRKLMSDGQITIELFVRGGLRDGMLRVWTVDSQKEVWKRDDHILEDIRDENISSLIWRIYFSPDGRLFGIISYSRSSKTVVLNIWDHKDHTQRYDYDTAGE
jgi:hypothetical protein